MWLSWFKTHKIIHERFGEDVYQNYLSARGNKADITILKHDLGLLYKQLAVIEKTIRGDK